MLVSVHSSSLLAEPTLSNETVAQQQSATDKLPANDDDSLIPILIDIDTDSALSLLDKQQAYISSEVSNLTKNIDEFFSDEKALYETNGSYIRLTGDTIFNEGGELGFVANTKVRVVLPNTQKKLKVIIENDPNESREDIQHELEDTPVEAAQEKTYFAGLESIWGEFKHWKFRPGIGLKLNSGLDVLLRVRASRNYAISNKWSAYFTDTLYWYESEGYNFDSRLEFDRKINNNLLFRSSSFAGWKEETEYWDMRQIFSLTQSLNERQQLIYQAGAYGVSKPEPVATDYLLQLRFRKHLHAEYLYLELIPKILYERETDYEASFSFTIRLEIVFKS